MRRWGRIVLPLILWVIIIKKVDVVSENKRSDIKYNTFIHTHKFLNKNNYASKYA